MNQEGCGDYIHTDTLINNIHTETTKIESGKYKIEAKVRSISDVYDFLRFGTKGSLHHKISFDNGRKFDYYYKDYDGSFYPAINYPTRPHPFEEHTLEQINGYIDSLGKEYSKRS